MQPEVRKYDTAKRTQVRVTPQHEQNYRLYLKFSNMTKPWPCRETSDPNGYTPIECFVYQDTYGKPLPCIDVDELHRVMHGKQMVNLQISMWVDGLMDGTLFKFELDDVISKEYPPWVKESVLRLFNKRRR